MTLDPFAAADPSDRPPSALTPVARRLAGAHAEIRAEPPPRIDYLHSVLCRCPLPPRRPADDRRIWERCHGHALLLLEAGRALDPRQGRFVELGLPFGEASRLLLIHLTGEAVRTGSRVIEVEGSMTAFMRGIGLDTGGHALRHLKDQLARLAAATVRLAVAEAGDRSRNVAARFISGFDLWFPRAAGQRVLWPSTVELSPEYSASLKGHAVPLDPRAIGALKHSALALDVYVWLAQRLWHIAPGRPEFVPWPRLKEQFGPEFGRLRDFRRRFLAVLRQVRLAYPEARLKDERGGLELHRSRPPVAPRLYPVRPL